MRSLWILLTWLAVATASAQTTNTPPPSGDAPFPGQAALRLQDLSLLRAEVKPNEIVAGHLTYSGIAVEIAKTSNPLQLVNPVALPKYGAAEDNAVRDPFSGRASGLKVFSISF